MKTKQISKIFCDVAMAVAGTAHFLHHNVAKDSNKHSKQNKNTTLNTTIKTFVVL